MLNFASASQVYLACGSTDMRKSIDGLAAIVQEQFALSPSPQLGLSFVIADGISSRSCIGITLAFGFTTVVWNAEPFSGLPAAVLH